MTTRSLSVIGKLPCLRSLRANGPIYIYFQTYLSLLASLRGNCHYMSLTSLPSELSFCFADIFLVPTISRNSPIAHVLITNFIGPGIFPSIHFTSLSFIFLPHGRYSSVSYPILVQNFFFSLFLTSSSCQMGFYIARKLPLHSSWYSRITDMNFTPS